MKYTSVGPLLFGWICKNDTVVTCLWVFADGHDVNGHNSPEACRCLMRNHG